MGDSGERRRISLLTGTPTKFTDSSSDSEEEPTVVRRPVPRGLWKSTPMPSNTPGPSSEKDGKKRTNDDNKNSRSVRQKTITEFTKPIISTTNRFQVLDRPEDEIMETQEANTPKIEKPPPIFVPKVGIFNELTEQLETIAKGEYSLKIINKDQVKISPKTSTTYTKIINHFKANKTEFYTFQLKEKRSFRVVLKNIHHSTPTDDLKMEIENQGHKVRQIHNILKRGTKAPLPMFFVDLEPAPNNKEIYEINRLVHCTCTIEPPNKKREIPQCQNCQRLGHTKAYCFRKPRCVKCGKFHDTKDCDKPKDTPAKCALCEGDHPANYKGCSVFKEIQRRKFPQLRPQVPNQTRAAPPPPRPTQPAPARQTTPEISYARIASNNNPQSNNRQTTPQEQNLETMMVKLMDRMDTMLNLLTALISKISQ